MQYQCSYQQQCLTKLYANRILQPKASASTVVAACINNALSLLQDTRKQGYHYVALKCQGVHFLAYVTTDHSNVGISTAVFLVWSHFLWCFPCITVLFISKVILRPLGRHTVYRIKNERLRYHRGTMLQRHIMFEV